MTTSRLRTFTAAAALLLPATLLAPGPAAAVVTECSGVPGDINGDGFADVAIGEPDGGTPAGGRVHVLYGTANGLATSATGDAPDDQVFGQAIAPIGGVDSPGDGFGASTLVEDLTGDGCADVAIGIPGNASDRGAVVILYGSITGISTSRALFLDGRDIVADDFPGQLFGFSLAAGDLDGDGVKDLAIGTPFAQVQEEGDDRGTVTVAFGPPQAIPFGRYATFRQGDGVVPGTDEDFDAFGYALAAGDVTGDGVDDLVIGAPGENRASGLVQVVPGVAAGGTRAAVRSFTQNTAGVPGSSEPVDNFGFALAVADVDGDGGGDVVTGVPGENGGRGAVVALFSDASGSVTGTGAQARSQDSAGLDGVAGADDFFGFSVAAGPLDSDGFADVAVGTPNDHVGSVVDAGSVTLLRGSSAGLSTAGYGGSRVTQNTAGVAGAPERDDSFGRSVAITAVQGGPVHNLVVSVTGEDIGGLANVGQSITLTATPSGPSGTGSQALYAGSPGVAGAARANSFWGVGLD